MRSGASRLCALAAALTGSGCLEASPGEPAKEDGGVVVGSPDAGDCEVAFLDEFKRNTIGEDWQYYGGSTEFVERGADGEHLTLTAHGGPNVGNPDDYAFGTLHMIERFAIAADTIEAKLAADPGGSGDVFFGWLLDSQYLGLQALSNGSMAVVTGFLGGEQMILCSGCVNFDPGAPFWRLRPDADGINVEVSTDHAVWTRLVRVDELPFEQAAPAVWAECDPTQTSGIEVDSVAVKLCPL